MVWFLQQKGKHDVSRDVILYDGFYDGMSDIEVHDIRATNFG